VAVGAAIVEAEAVDIATAMAAAIKTAVPARIIAKQKPGFSRNGPGHPGPFFSSNERSDRVGGRFQDARRLIQGFLPFLRGI
jgi:hypothetical protein